MNLLDPDSVVLDDDKLSMSDEEMQLIINVVLTKDYYDYSSIEEVPDYAVYPIKLLVQKELCLTLAIKFSEDYDMTADNNNQLKEGQKFTHYLALADHFDRLYNKYIEDGGAGGHVLNSYDVLLGGHHYYTQRNYDKGVPPALSLKVQGTYEDSIEISWEVKGLKRLLNYKVFVSEIPILDIYIDNGKISGEARLVTTIGNPHNKRARITELEPETDYYILVVVAEQNGLKGMSEIKVTTGGE